LRSTQQMATTFLLRCIFIAMVPRGGRLVLGNPAKEEGKPLRVFFMVLVVQNPRCRGICTIAKK
jgi:hypothetical protein